MKEQAPHSAIKEAWSKTEQCMVMDTAEGYLEMYKLAAGYGNFN